jgi:hypothetical protein
MSAEEPASWWFRPGRRIAHARRWDHSKTSPCGQSLAMTKRLSSYDPNHVGIRPCHICTRALTQAEAAS